MNESLKACQHCGTPFAPTSREENFCCAGCNFVHQLIGTNGMRKFYDLKGNDAIMPVGNGVLMKLDASWASGIQAEAEAKEGSMAEATMDLQGVSCVGCVWLVDAAFQREPGAGRAIIDPTRGTVTLSWIAGDFDLACFVERVAQFGYRLAPYSHGENPSQASGLKLGLCGGLAMNAMAFTLPRYVGMSADFALANIFEMIAAFSATVSLATGGAYFIQRAWNALKLRRLHLDVPIAIGIVAAYLGSVAGWFMKTPGLLYFDFVAVFVFLMLLGRRLQETSVSRNRHRLLRADPSMQQVCVNEAGAWVKKSVESLEPGMAFQVSAGGVVPVSSELLKDTATLSLEWITGEAEPIIWGPGAILPAGAVQLSQRAVHLRAREAWKDSLLHRLLKASTSTDDPAARWLDRTLRIYLSIILFAATVGGIVWILRGADWPEALQVFVSVLVVSCPCALGVAVPMAHELAVARLREQGLFVRASDLWGRLLRVKKVVFDKTGTLTLETPRLTNPGALEKLEPTAISALATMVSQSLHPISGALREVLAAEGSLATMPNVSIEELPGYGLRLTDARGVAWELRRPAATDSGDVMFTRNGEITAAFSFSEQLRGDAPAEVEKLRRRELEIFLLSGDREEKVARMAARLQIPANQALARQTPEDKGAWMAANGSDALFVGDGANDSLAAQNALCSGTLAVERTLLAEHADFYFLSRSLRPLRLLLEVAGRRRRAVLRAWSFALAYNIAVVVMALGGHMNPLLAAILMPLSSIVTLAIVSLTMRPAAKLPVTGTRYSRSPENLEIAFGQSSG